MPGSAIVERQCPKSRVRALRAWLAMRPSFISWIQSQLSAMTGLCVARSNAFLTARDEHFCNKVADAGGRFCEIWAFARGLAATHR